MPLPIFMKKKKNANIFKKYFCSLADDLLANLFAPYLKFDLHSVRQYYEKILKYPNSIFKFNFLSLETILKFLQDLNENKAASLHNLSDKFLKDGTTVLVKPISQICNLCIKYSTFPSDCKKAKLKPLFKIGSKVAPKNYRPLSLLPLVSKTIEKVIHDQTQSFLDKNDIIYRYQLGFTTFFSTNSCLSY